MENFTEREQDIIKCIVLGKTNKQIAKELFISFHTVKAVIEHIYRKAEVSNRVQLAVLMKDFCIKDSR